MMRLTEALSAAGGEMAIADLVDRLGLPRSTLYGVIRAMIEEDLLVDSARGRVRLARSWLDMALASARQATERTTPERDREPAARETMTPVARSFLWNPVLTGVVDCTRFRKPPPYRIGFANGSRSNHWRLALLDAVARSAKAHVEVGELIVLNADDDQDQQVRDLADLASQRVDIALVSPVNRHGVSEAMRELTAAGVPIVVVDRTIDDDQAYITHVFSADASIGRIPALWLVERLAGRGGILMLCGMKGTTPVEQRMQAATEVFDIHPEIEVLEIAYTGWTREGGFAAAAAAIERHGTRIAGVWCDSGQQGVGSLDAFVAAGLSGRIPPHTGGDLNAMYQQSLRLGVPIAAIDYPPAMGGRAVDVCVEILAGKRVLRRIEMPSAVVISRGFDTPSVRADIYVEDHVRWDEPETFIMGQETDAGGDAQVLTAHAGGL